MPAILVKLTVRRGTTAEWTAANPVLLDGEMTYDTDEKLFKVGDGTQAWLDLDYQSTAPTVTDLGTFA